MKKCIRQSYRRKMLILICFIFILVITGNEFVKKIDSIEKKQITAFVDENLREGFEEISETPVMKIFYDVSYSDDNKNSSIILTTDIEKIDTSKEYDVIAQSPLILMMKNNVDFNDLLTQYNEKGFLISESRIRTSSNDPIDCDFTKVVEAINAGGKWSDLGIDETKEIIVYCPKLDTPQGKIFKEFLVRSFSKGLNESNEETEKKIQMFFESENVIQTDVYHKLQMLKDDISPYAIFVGFEHDLLNFYNNYNTSFVFVYPEKNILENIYLQINSEDEALKEQFLCEDSILDIGIYSIFHKDYYYRLGETGEVPKLSYYSNVQTGIDTFEN